MGKRVLKRYGVVPGICAAAVGAALLLAAPAAAQFPGKNGKIAFSSARDESGNRDIYTMNADGTGVTRLTTAPYADDDPRWSPDGTKIAFDSGRNSTSPGSLREDIYVMNADGSGQTKLVDTAGDPAWSPDGRRIVYEAGADLYTMNADGSGQTNLTNTPSESEFWASWSPDGRKIAFTSFAPCFSEQCLAVFVMNADGTGLRTHLTPQGNSGNFRPDWSPDGSRIVFTYEDYNCGDEGCDWFDGIGVANPDGSGGTRIANDDGSYAARWSPDGQKLVFYSKGIRTMNADGSGTTSISGSPGDARMPDWQPLPGPQRSDYRNAAKFCDALRGFLGDADFTGRFGANGKSANAYGKCVSSN